MEARWVGEGMCEQDTFQDSEELAWSVRKTVVGRCGGVDRAA